MNRLWIRFSVIIISFSFVIIPLWIVLDRLDPVISMDGISFDDDIRLYSLTGELAETMLMVGTIAIILGIWLSRGLSAPIVALSEAAKQFGSGDLQERVPVYNHSQELDDLAHSFNRMATELENAETLRNKMLADISHELRTPLTVLSGQLHAALDKVVTLDEEHLANLYGQTRHLIALVDDLHLLAQAEAHQLPLAIGVVNLADLWRELAANFFLVAEEKEVQFHIDKMDKLPPISADPGRLRQLFSNLLDNAIRHTPPGGEVVVTGVMDDEQIVVEISDSGEGISAEQLTHLFDRFYRVDRSRTRDTGGSGLGLAIVKALIEIHQGEISAKSAGLNQGSTFTVRLPIQIT